MERNKNLRTNSKLTEFAPLSPEASEPGVGYQLLSKFFSFGKDAPPESVSPTHSASDTSSKMTSSRSKAESSASSKAVLAVSHFPVNISERRSLPNVLKRISNLLALKSNNLQAYKDTDFKQYWMPDSVSRECYDCEEKFTTFRRRHHCRVCGQIFCSKCCNQEIPGKIMGCTGDLRVCTYCCKVVLSYLQSPDMGADMSSDLRALQEDLQTKFGGAPTTPSVSIMPSIAGSSLADAEGFGDSVSARRKLSVGFQEDKFALGRAQGTGYLSMEERCRALQKSASLRTLHEDLCTSADGIVLQTHRFRLRNYPGCFQGSELVDWLIAHNRAANRLQGSAIGQALMEGGFLETISEQHFVDDYSLYRPRQATLLVTSSSVPTNQDSHEPLWVKQIPQPDSATTTDSESEPQISDDNDDSLSLPSSSSTFYLDLNVDDSTVHISRPKQDDDATSHTTGKPSVASVSSPVHDCPQPGISELLLLQSTESNMAPTQGWYKAANLRTDNGELQAYCRLSSAFKQHETSFCKQLLNAEGLSQTWLDVIIPLCHQIVDVIRPDVRNETAEMDIRKYVQWKKVCGDSRAESRIVNGVVCSKNVAHRAMSARLANPRILLLQCSIVYQRIEGRLMSIEPVMMQEHEYLRHVVQRIVALGPDIILVHRSVCRLAQELLLAHRITLVLHVKASVLERVARLTHADIATSVDAHIGRPRLGTCGAFHLKTFAQQIGSTSKTLMFFEDCTFPNLGCTVLLRGGPRAELAKVKRVASRMLFARYNWRLEKSFLMDEFSRPPSPPPIDTFFREESNTPIQLELEPSAVGSSTNHSNLREVLSEKTDSDKSVSSKKVTVNENLFRDDKSKLEEKQTVLKSEISSKDREEKRTDEKFFKEENVKLKERTNIDSRSSKEVDHNLKEKVVVDNVEEKTRKEKSTAEDKRMNVSDFSDPLHLYMNLEDEVFIAGQQTGTSPAQSMAVAELPTSNRFRKALDDTILSVSPFIKFTVPFLETEAGRHCVLRQYFPSEVFTSAQFSDAATSNRISNPADHTSSVCQDIKTAAVKILPAHAFVSSKLTQPADSDAVQTLLADYRARGGRLHPIDPLLKTRAVSTCEEPTGLSTPTPPDSLDPANHQRLAVLFCSFSRLSQNAPAFCVNPWVVQMELYGRNDISLGNFLERYCFRPSYSCPSDSCDTPMLAHVRRFVHDSGCVHIGLNHLDKVIAESANILMWSWCASCRQATPVVAMSTDTWALSFAKYLELRFHGVAYTPRAEVVECSHSLHHEHYQYFGCRNIVASFKYTRVDVWEVSLPPPMIVIHYDPTQQAHIIEEIKVLALKGYDVYSSILEKLCALGNEVEGVVAMKQQRTQEHAILKSCIEEIQLKLTSPTLESKKLEGKTAEKEVQQLMWRIQDAVVQLKVHIADAVCSWNARIQEFTQHSKRRQDEKAARKSTDSGRLLSAQSSSQSLEGDTISQVSTDAILDASASSSGLETSSLSLEEANTSSVPESEPGDTRVVNEAPSCLVMPSVVFVASFDSDTIDTAKSQPLTSHSEGDQSQTSDEGPSNHGSPRIVEPHSEATTEQNHDKKSVKNILSQLRHPQLGFSPIQNPLSPTEHHLPVTGCTIPLIVYENEPSSIISYALSSLEYKRSLDDIRKKHSATDHPTPSPLAKRKSGGYSSDKEGSTELSQSVESRRSTVLSFLRGGNNNGGASSRSSGIQDGQTCHPAAPLPDPPPPESDESVKKSPQVNLYIEVQFSDATTNFFCRVYFAEPFAALRSLVLPAGEDAFVRSLCRCVRWAARGGKSGSMFCKTGDERFILKELPRVELQLFLDFAPHYFSYVMQCHAANQPTLLSKIVGVYRVVYRNAATNATLKSNLLVMENLFYDRSVTHKFDLKGSVRNRLVNPSDDPLGEVVLLDENLLKMTCESPLYMLPHTKSVLSQAIDNDTQFLASQEVMDYSLLVGLDQDKRELVVGIIDYIRTFTWDKKLETMVKSSGILGGQGKLPTVVSPELYRARFIASMHQYFLPVPDRWAGLGRELD